MRAYEEEEAIEGCASFLPLLGRGPCGAADMRLRGDHAAPQTCVTCSAGDHAAPQTCVTCSAGTMRRRRHASPAMGHAARWRTRWFRRILVQRPHTQDRIGLDQGTWYTPPWLGISDDVHDRLRQMPARITNGVEHLLRLAPRQRLRQRIGNHELAWAPGVACFARENCSASQL